MADLVVAWPCSEPEIALSGVPVAITDEVDVW